MTKDLTERLKEADRVFLQAHDALEVARDLMRGASEPQDVVAYNQVNAALYAVRGRPDLTEAASLIQRLEGERDATGWLYTCDDGWEWSPNHPIDSGENTYATNVRRATPQELVERLKDLSEGHNEALSGEAKASARAIAAEQALSASQKEVERLTEWLLKIQNYVPTGCDPAIPDAPYIEIAKFAKGAAALALQTGGKEHA